MCKEEIQLFIGINSFHKVPAPVYFPLLFTKPIHMKKMPGLPMRVEKPGNFDLICSPQSLIDPAIWTGLLVGFSEHNVKGATSGKATNFLVTMTKYHGSII